MKPAPIVLAVIVITASQIAPFAAHAQMEQLKQTTPEQRATLQTALMAERLGLTADQKTKVAALNLTYATKMEPIIKGSAGPLREMREIRQINDEKEAELKQILTPTQFQQYLASKEEMRQKFEKRILENAGKS